MDLWAAAYLWGPCSVLTEACQYQLLAILQGERVIVIQGLENHILLLYLLPFHNSAIGRQDLINILGKVIQIKVNARDPYDVL